MDETDVSVQIYSFLEVTAVRYDEKPDKDGQRCALETPPPSTPIPHSRPVSFPSRKFLETRAT